MKKLFTTIIAGLMISAQVMAVSVKDVCGQFDGNLNIGSQLYPNKSVYLLPGVEENTVTFVLPDFIYNNGNLGNIVLPNIPMSSSGQLTLDNATLYLDSIQERATITVLNGLEDGGNVYNSIVTATDAMVVLSIVAPSVSKPIFVLFVGTAAAAKNYELTNGGFEGDWTNKEPQGWHSFGTADGLLAGFVNENTFQFVQSTVVRPGSTGKNSALLSSNILFGVAANGNCTNGRINAGSMTADDAKGNFNYSHPDSTGFNTPFHGRPDSIVFWAKYQPADLNPANEKNKARLNAVITTNARYQDPEDTVKYGDIVLGKATINYAATSNMGWQRLSVPFEYVEANKDKEPAYILTTFSTNMVPGGGSSYSEGGIFDEKTVVDSIYLDDVEIVYKKELASFKMGANELSFTDYVAKAEGNYCDDCAKFAAQAAGLSAQPFIAFDATHKCIYVYVIAEDYAQSGNCNIYLVEFADSVEPIASVVENTFTGKRFEKIIMNGQLFIHAGDMWFNAAGVRVQ